MKKNQSTPNADGYRDQNEPGAGPHPKVKGYTGPYKYKDAKSGQDAIDTATKYQMADMKGFKGAKDTSTEWLTKKNPVNEKVNEWYHPHKGQEEL